MVFCVVEAKGELRANVKVGYRLPVELGHEVCAVDGVVFRLVIHLMESGAERCCVFARSRASVLVVLACGGRHERGAGHNVVFVEADKLTRDVVDRRAHGNVVHHLVRSVGGEAPAVVVVPYDYAVLLQISEAHIICAAVVASREVDVEVVVDGVAHEIVLKVLVFKEEHLARGCRVFHGLPAAVGQQVLYISLAISGNPVIEKRAVDIAVDNIVGAHAE